MATDIKRLLKWLENFEQRVGQRFLDGFRRFQLVALGCLLEFVEQVSRRFNADIAGQQKLFEFFEQFVIDFATRENGLELAAQLGAGLGQPLEEAFAPRRGGIGSRSRVNLGVGSGFFQETEHGEWGLK